MGKSPKSPLEKALNMTVPICAEIQKANLTNTSLCGGLSCVRNPLCGMIKVSLCTCMEPHNSHRRSPCCMCSDMWNPTVSTAQLSIQTHTVRCGRAWEALISPDAYPAWILLGLDEGDELGGTWAWICLYGIRTL